MISLERISLLSSMKTDKVASAKFHDADSKS